MPRNVSRKERPMPPPAPVISTRCIIAASLGFRQRPKPRRKPRSEQLFLGPKVTRNLSNRFGGTHDTVTVFAYQAIGGPLHGPAVGRPRYRLPLLRNHGDDLHLDQPGPDPV